jgi:SAM-dependent methyltransferase
MNYFSTASTAESYARFRPYFHPLVVGKIAETTGKVGVALDVGCGTGQSTLALLTIAERVIGVDASEEMLGHAHQDSGLTYIRAFAEELPFDNQSIDLLTVGLAYHWFEQARFLKQVTRVLKPNGWLALYNDYFTGAMVGNSAYEKWHNEVYLPRFPLPPRNLRPASNRDWDRSGLKPASRVTFPHYVKAGIDSWSGYLMSQSNVGAVLESGSESDESVRSWLLDQLRLFIATESQTFVFHCRLDVFQLQDKPDERPT